MWKNNVFRFGICKKGLQFCIGKWKKAFCASFHRVRKIFYNICPLMCEVIGLSAMAEINYNTQKWSNGGLFGRTICS
jgi:hypothetical protein